MKFKIGDRVGIALTAEGTDRHGQTGEIVKIDARNYYPYSVKFPGSYDTEVMQDEEMIKLPKKTKAKAKPKQTYLGNGKHEWELVVEGDYRGTSTVRRLRVPGGWVYDVNYGSGVFVPLVEVTGHVI